MPLARRFSNSSQGSVASRRLSLPSTVNSSTHVTAEKAEKMMSRRRQTRQQARKELAEKLAANKENARNNRNKVPKMETRSSKKKKLVANKNYFGQVPTRGAMFFSPPDQKANARREKEEMERQDRKR